MTFVALLPVILSCLVLGAHFLRAGVLPLVVVCVALPLLLIARRRWVKWTIQSALFLGGLEWLRTIAARVADRRDVGESWGTMAVILGAVAFVSFASILVFKIPRVKRRYEHQV
jgi:hypothetical protein